MEAKTQKIHWGRWVFFLLLIGVAVYVVLNRVWLYDYYRGMTYQPSAEMVRIRDDLRLTERGEFLFNATQPVLSEAAEFNSHCRDEGAEDAVLGCYTMGNIYVYNIDSTELQGIRELTTAHELLHANWARMSENERIDLVSALTHVFEANQDFLGTEIDTYDISQKQEELYVRAGTEVADLPMELEKHYGEIFEDQDKIVAYYDSYIGVFKALTAEMDALKAEMESINATINQRMTEYEERSGQLNADVVSFNSCAKVAGCFATEEEFDTRRAVLVEEQEALERMYDEISRLIDTYNVKVELYNADVTQGEKLNTIINSNSKPQEIK